MRALCVLLAAACASPAAATPFETGAAITVAQGGLHRGQLPGGSRDLTLDGKPVRIAGDGSYLIGFGRDAPPAATLQWRSATGETVTRPITITPRQWRIQSLPTLPPRPVPDTEFEARRPGEVEKITAARAAAIADGSGTGWATRFTPPAIGPITGVFGSQRILAGTPSAPHAGLDIGAKAGSPVTAPAAGMVRLAQGPFTLEGNLVMIDHGMGLVSAFLHLSRIDVKPGDVISQGQQIGLVGGTGRATGPHLHWGLTWTDVRVDPAPLLGSAP